MSVPATHTNLLQGSCLCGKFRYEGRSQPLLMYYCHGIMCRKATGTSFATNKQVRAEDFSILSGQDDLKAYRSSPDELRHFCLACGSPVFSEVEHRLEILSIRCGLLDRILDCLPEYADGADDQ